MLVYACYTLAMSFKRRYNITPSIYVVLFNDLEVVISGNDHVNAIHLSIVLQFNFYK